MRSQIDGGPVTWPAIVVHGGAGTYARLYSNGAEAPSLVEALEQAIGEALDAGWRHLAGGDGAVGAVVAAVQAMENHGGFNAGRGSVRNTAGEAEMDAAVMAGDGRAGAVACIQSHSAVRAAEAVLREGKALILAGPNADMFAAGAAVAELIPLPSAEPVDQLSDQGTVGAVAVTADGRFAAATSTGGRANQPPGRVGDTPIPGAGSWASESCAVTATGFGEAFVMAGFSRLVASRSAGGEDIAQALNAGLEEVARYGGTGGGIALGPDATWAAAFSTRAMARGVRHSGGGLVTVIDS
jgi:beta-aspartyl-peptidase (threonine type)